MAGEREPGGTVGRAHRSATGTSQPLTGAGVLGKLQGGVDVPQRHTGALPTDRVQTLHPDRSCVSTASGLGVGCCGSVDSGTSPCPPRRWGGSRGRAPCRPLQPQLQHRGLLLCLCGGAGAGPLWTGDGPDRRDGELSLCTGPQRESSPGEEGWGPGAWGIGSSQESGRREERAASPRSLGAVMVSRPALTDTLKTTAP